MRPRAITICLTITVLAMLWPQPISGRPVSPTLEMLTKAATLIVVAQVEEVNQQPDMRVATARVLEVWKGTPPEKVHFRASKSWVCDSSHAVVGETIVLFLLGDSGKVMSIAYSGMGRLTFSNAEGNQTVGLPGYLLSKEAKRELGVAPEKWGAIVELNILRGYVQQIAESPMAKRRRLRLTTR